MSPGLSRKRDRRYCRINRETLLLHSGRRRCPDVPQQDLLFRSGDGDRGELRKDSPCREHRESDTLCVGKVPEQLSSCE